MVQDGQGLAERSHGRECRRGWLRGVLTAGLLAAASAQALDPQRALSEFTLARMDSGGGLPHNMVMALAQTPDGYLWAGTWEGLARWNHPQRPLMLAERHGQLMRVYYRAR